MSQHVQIIEAAEVQQRIDPVRLLSALRAHLIGLTQGTCVQPPQTVVDLTSGADVITYHSLDLQAGLYGLKISPYLPQPDGKAIVSAWTIVFDTSTGRPVALLDSGSLTAHRTAATSTLAVECLADAPRTVTIIGVGPLAREHLRYVARLEHVEQITIVGRDLDHAKRAVSQWLATDEHLSNGKVVVVSDNAADRVKDADALMLCTSAAEPVIDLLARPAGSVTTSISTNAPKAHEIDPAALTEVDVYVDYAARALSSAAEFQIARDAGQWSDGMNRGDLTTLLYGSATPPSGTRPVYFRSIGMGIADLAAAQAILT